MMTTLTRCERCGQTFESSRFLRNQCPACLFAQALPDEVEGTYTPPGRFEPPRIAELAPLFPQLEIQELAGFGGMSAVYRASQTQLGRTVAIKILPLEIAASHGGLERFQREARTLARLNHPNIVQVYDAGQAGQWCYIMMEFVAGPNLRQVLGDSHLSSSEVLKIASAICDGLQYAHDQGVVHRDIKPENVLLDSEGRVKLVDFGLAKLSANESDPAATLTAQILGTPHYLAPEQIETPAAVDHRADVYSLGVLMYEMLTGELPLGHFQPPSRRAGSDPALDDVVLQAMAKDRLQRYQHVRDLRAKMGSTILKGPGTQPVGPRITSFDPERAAVGRQPSSVVWQRIQEVALSAGSLLSGFVGVMGIMMGIVILVDIPKMAHPDPSAPNVMVAHPAAPPSLLIGIGLISVVLSFLFARLNVTSLSRWKDLAWTQFPSLPALLSGYALFAFALLFGPGLAVLLLGAMPLLGNHESWNLFGRSFLDSDRASILTPYWLRVYGVGLLAAATWCLPFGIVLRKYPDLVRGVFHPMGDRQISIALQGVLLAAVAIFVPLGLVLLMAS